MLSTMSFMNSSGAFSPIILYVFSFIALPMAYIGFYELIKTVNFEETSKIKKKEKISIKQSFEKNKGYIKVLLVSICSIVIVYVVIWMMMEYGYIDFHLFYFFDIIFITILLLIGPIGFYKYFQDQKLHEIKEKLPNFFVKIGNSISSGTTVIDAIRVASKDNFGRLSNEIRIMKSQLSWNISTKDVFINFVERMESTHIKRMFVAINKALDSGGDISRVFKAAAKEIDQVNRLEEQRKANMSSVTMSILMSFFSFLAIIVIINNTIFTSFFNQQDQMSSAAGLSFSIIDETYLKYALFSFVIVQSIGSGILGGFMKDGTIFSGVRFSFVLGLLSLIVFKLII
jgi:flagellar protein FlaJ